MKRLMKLTSFVCAVAIVLSSSAYAAEVEQGSSEMLEKKVEALLDSKKTENHIEALKLLKENGYEVQETVYNEYDA